MRFPGTVVVLSRAEGWWLIRRLAAMQRRACLAYRDQVIVSCVAEVRQPRYFQTSQSKMASIQSSRILFSGWSRIDAACWRTLLFGGADARLPWRSRFFPVP